ncbi:hypothetical protein DDV21_010225 [Streptococcus chenjunshii]|uniref:Phage protein n=2 Tax=Streptococcus chenjunshii TaxID=2173853 RepID=A0A372KNU1_9STRE|nr:hypothetical protein DDV21_010225 [Streptococcus chenjunshii]RFU51140.1 hypothetical protein DDV22_05275 [Streptococcus chenjunshii]RFU53238.1 hypothetical protein DDV23_05785 [Streptococcus chenjunshii]
MLETLYAKLKDDKTLRDVTIKSFVRPEGLAMDAASIVIIPIISPEQAVRASNTSLSKKFVYQINVESVDRKEAKDLQRRVEKVMESLGFYQIAGGLEDFISDVKRYVDARTYRGFSPLYEDY